MRQILIFLFPTMVLASFDFNYGTSMRSFPSLGGGLSGNLGYSYLLRGEQKSPFNSLIRAGLKVDTSIVVHQVEPNITLYPLGFIGIGGGKKMLNSDYKDFTYYDCEEIRCTGKLDKEYKFIKVAIGYATLLSTYSYTEYTNSYTEEDSSNSPVAEYRYALEVNPKEEDQVDKKAFLGYKMDEKTIIGISTNRAEFLKSDKVYDLNLGIYSKSFENFNIIFGAGTLHSSDVGSGGVFVFRFKHQILPSMALF